ncbi:MAG: hypothetical protein K2M95_03760 [Clostridiales bacterium]|nr:hypothetical protein [Clostridiales bacterium]
MSNAWWSAILGGGIAVIAIIALCSGLYYNSWIVKKQLEKQFPEFKNNKQNQIRWWLIWTAVHCLQLVVYTVLFCILSSGGTVADYARIMGLSFMASLFMIFPEIGVRLLVEACKGKKEKKQ